MLDSPNALQVLGLYIEDHVFKGAVLTEHKGKPALEKVFLSEIQENEEGQPYFSQDIQAALTSLLPQTLVGTALGTDEVLVRPLDIKLQKDSEIASVVPFQSEPLLPYPIENAMVDWIKLNNTLDGSRLTIVAARKDYIEKQISLWNDLKIEPELISTVPNALTAFAAYFSESPDLQIILHVGNITTSCLLVDQEKLLAAQSTSRGIRDIIQAIQLDKPIEAKAALAQLKPEEINRLPHLSELLDQFRIDITRIILGISKQVKGFESKEVLLTGEIGLYPTLVEFLFQNLSFKPTLPLERPNFPLTNQELQLYAIPIGIALTGLPGKKNQINFRQEQYAFPHPWLRLKKPLITYFASCLLLAFALYSFTLANFSKSADNLRQEYVNVLASLHKSYPEFEAEYRKNARLPALSPDETLNPKTLSLDDLSARVDFLRKQFQTNPDSYPLFPNTPSVSEVLAWIANHPSFKPSEGKEALKIENFNYKMIKRPDKNKKNEVYQVKVEFDFSAPNPTRAREFHDALIAPNEIVDPRGEIKWGTNHGLYHTSFFLKDRTLYPSAIK